MPSKTYSTVIKADPDGSSMTAIDVPFDPKAFFGKVRAPVVVKVGKHTFRSTVCSMGGSWWVPLRQSNREAAGVEGGQRVTVTLTLDDAPRVVEAPADLKRSLKAAGAWATWEALSFTHKREYAEAIDDAKKPETRQRRIDGCTTAMALRANTVSKKPTAKAVRKKPSRK